MGKKRFVLLAAAGVLALVLYGGVSKVWVADQGDGTYRNPILYADYSDPDVIRVGEDFYLVASSFEAVPGIPILHSRDLVNWELIGHAFERQVPEDVFSTVQHGGGPGLRRSGITEASTRSTIRTRTAGFTS